jgi:DNA polymerase III epsilon subunit-like protein
MSWRSRSIVAFDTETTGLYPENGDRVIEFAGIELRLGPDGSVREVVPHHYLFNPGIPIPREASEVSGLKDEDVAGKPSFAAHADAVHRLLANAITVAHNYPFDQRFLTQELARCGLKWPAPPAEIDTVDLSRRFFSEARGHKLAEVCTRLEIALVGAHRATNDAEACGRAFVALTQRFGAPEDIEGLIDWADAVGEPPGGGAIRRGEDGVLVFGSGRHVGEPIEEHPDSLAYMLVARERVEGAWRLVWSDSVRRWVERWLRVRASGRAPQVTKGFGPGDWGIDPPAGTSVVGGLL